MGKIGTIVPWAVLALGPLLPLARILHDPTRYLPGAPLGDIHKHVWSFWHTPSNLAHGGWPETPWLAAPDGGVILDAMLIPSLIMWPVQALAGPVAAMNVWIALSLFACGAATFALARELTRSTAGAVCAGLAVQSCSFLLGYPLTSGVSERLAIWAFPLTLLALIRIRSGGGWRWPLVVVLTAAFLCISSPAYGVFLAALVLLALPLLLAPSNDRTVLSNGLRLLPTLVSLALVSGAAMLVVRGLFVHPDSILHTPVGNRLGLAPGTPSDALRAASPALLLWPPAVADQQPLISGDVLYDLYYLGWVPLAAAVVGVAVALHRRRFAVAYVAVLGGVFALLAVGPGLGGAPNLPYLALCHLVPGYAGIPYPWQQVALSEALVPVGLAMAVASLPRRAHRLVLAGVLFLAVVGERALVLLVPLAVWTTDARVSRVYDSVDGPGTLMDLPARQGDLYPGDAFLAQMSHGQPITASIDHGKAPWDDYPVAQGARSGNWPADFACFADSGIRWVVIHRERLSDTRALDRGMFELERAGLVTTADDGTLAPYDLSRSQAIRTTLPSPDCPDGALASR